MQASRGSGRVLPEGNTQDVYFSLALEEILLDVMPRSPHSFILRYWRNPRAVVIGRGQEVKEEVNEAFCKANGINVARRISGGGAVYHDEGNLNISCFFSKKILHGATSVKEINALFTNILIDSLALAGIADLKMEGTSNILYQDKKISGSAGYQKANHALHHATLLLGADLDMLEGSLIAKEKNPPTTRASKYWPTTNLPAFDLNRWKAALSSLLGERLGVMLETSPISPVEEKMAHALADRMYSTRAWIHDKKRVKIKELLNEIGFQDPS